MLLLFFLKKTQKLLVWLFSWIASDDLPSYLFAFVPVCGIIYSFIKVFTFLIYHNVITISIFPFVMCYEYKQLKYIPTLSIGWLVGIWGSDLSRDAQAFLSSSHILWVFWGIPRCFQASRQRDLISLACPGSTLGSPLGSNCGKHFT